MLAQYNSGSQFSPVTSTSGCGLFCTGQQTYAATVPVGGASLLLGGDDAFAITAVQQLMSFDNGLKLVQAANATFNRGVGFSQALNAALTTARVKTAFPNTLVGAQLQTVAKVMSVRRAWHRTQVFFCQLGGFDTHGTQSSQQDPLLQQLTQAIGQFYLALQEVGTDKNTVTFTASESGVPSSLTAMPARTTRGAAHHLIVGTNTAAGGPLYGGQFYGQCPSLALGGANDANTRGTMVPTTWVDQYSATMAQWFGVSPANIAQSSRCGEFSDVELGIFEFELRQLFREPGGRWNIQVSLDEIRIETPRLKILVGGMR